MKAHLFAIILALVSGFPLRPVLSDPASPTVVPNHSLTGKVMTGYQGWFNTATDGAGRGWRHITDTPGSADFEMWPDTSELEADERYATRFTHRDGRPAELYSAYNEKTVVRHFKWMRDYGLDGVFMQRFLSEVSEPTGRDHFDKVLRSARKGAETYGRVYGVMYDLSGSPEGCADALIADWKALVDKTRLTSGDRYVRHRGKPVVAIWGFGFEGDRPALLDDGLKMVEFLKHDPVYGGNVVMLGVPWSWRTTDTAKIPFAKMEKLVLAADIVSPWAVGSAKSPAEVTANAEGLWKPDMAWCRDHGKDYMPVVFPGFSWHNLRRGGAPLNEIPRLRGRFLWTQYLEAKKAGATMLYQAMFDEIDEGTAIFKVTNDVPVPAGGSEFIGLEGLPSDFYLRLVGQGARLLRGEIKAEDDTLVRSAQ